MAAPTLVWGPPSGERETPASPEAVWPAGAATDVLFLFAFSKGTTSTIATPAGWDISVPLTTLAATQTVIFRRTAGSTASGSVTLSVSNADSTACFIARAPAGTTVDSFVTALDNSADTTLTAAASSSLNLTTDDRLVAAVAYRNDATGMTATIGASGTAALGATTTHVMANMLNGSDMHASGHSAVVTTAGTATPSISGSWSGGQAGSAGITFLAFRGLPSAIKTTVRPAKSGTTASRPLLTVAAPELPKAHTLTDDFVTADTTKWIWSADASSVGGRARINAAPYYPAVTSVAPYDLTESHFGAELVTRPNAGNGSTAAIIVARRDADNLVELGVAGDGSVFCRERLAASNSDTYITYSATDHRWLRVREAAGSIYWEASPDGVNWNTLRTKTSLLDLSSVTLSLVAGNWNNEPNPGYAEFDNVNPAVVATVPTVSVGTDEPDHEVGTAFVRTPVNTGAAATSHRWELADGTVLGTAETLTWTPATVGTYTITYTASNDVGSSTDSLDVRVVAPGAIVPAAMGDWHEVFVDEFPGTALDPAKWAIHDGKTQNAVTTSATNVSVVDGELRLQLSSSTSGAQVTSQQVDGIGNADGYTLPVGGYTEARVWFPGDGVKLYNWSAWWTVGATWPLNGELDIAEIFDVPGNLTANYHTGEEVWPAPPTSTRIHTSYRYWGDAWHRFGVHRKEGSADFYWDGELIGSQVTNDDGGGHSLTFTVGYSGDGRDVFGQDGALRVDWVRAWSPGPPPTIPASVRPARAGSSATRPLLTVRQPATVRTAESSTTATTPTASHRIPVAVEGAVAGTSISRPLLALRQPTTVLDASAPTSATTPTATHRIAVDAADAAASTSATRPLLAVHQPTSVLDASAPTSATSPAPGHRIPVSAADAVAPTSASRPLLGKQQQLEVLGAVAPTSASRPLLAVHAPLGALGALASTSASRPLLAVHTALAVRGATAGTSAGTALATHRIPASVRTASAPTTATRPSPSQHTPLAVQGATASTSVTQPLPSVRHLLAVLDAAVDTSATRPEAAQRIPLAVRPATASTSASRPRIYLAGSVQVRVARAHASVTRPLLAQHTPMAVLDAIAGSSAVRPTVAQRHTALVAGALVDTSATRPLLRASGSLAVRDARAAATATRPLLSQHTPLQVLDAVAVTSAERITLTRTTRVLIRPARSATTSTTVLPTHHSILTVRPARAPTRAQRVILPGSIFPSAPPERTFVVEADPRLFTVPEDPRRYAVPADHRTLIA